MFVNVKVKAESGRKKRRLEFEDDGIAGRDAELFGSVALADGDLKLAVAIDQGKGAIVGGLGISAKKWNRDRFAFDGEIQQLAGSELGELGSGNIGENVAVMIDKDHHALGEVGHDRGGVAG